MKAKQGSISYPNTLDKVVRRYEDLSVEVQSLLDDKLPQDVNECRYIVGVATYSRNGDSKGCQFTIIDPSNIGYSGFSFQRPDDVYDQLLGEKKACRRAIKSMVLARENVIQKFLCEW